MLIIFRNGFSDCHIHGGSGFMLQDADLHHIIPPPESHSKFLHSKAWIVTGFFQD